MSSNNRASVLNVVTQFAIAIDQLANTVVWIPGDGFGYADETLSARAWRLAVSVDQTANAVFNGNEDETISSRAGRHKDEEKWACWLCWLLDHIDQNHCEKSIGV